MILNITSIIRVTKIRIVRVNDQDFFILRIVESKSQPIEIRSRITVDDRYSIIIRTQSKSIFLKSLENVIELFFDKRSF